MTGAIHYWQSWMTWLPYLAGGFVVLAAAVAAMAIVYLRRRAKPAAIAAASASRRPPPRPAPAADEEEAEGGAAALRGQRGPQIAGETATLATPLAIRQSFRAAADVLRAQFGRWVWPYRLPWFVMIGPEGSGKSRVLRESKLPLPLGQPDETGGGSAALKWWFFDRGVVLDVGGALIAGRGGRAGDERGWAAIFDTLDRYRAQTPLDGVVLTLPADELLAVAGSPASAIQRAEEIYQRLRVLQAKTGMCLPVYVLITKSDAIPGFSSFASELPAARRNEIFGWSNPYALESAYNPAWVEEAGEQITAVLEATQLEIFATGNEVADPDGVMTFPAAFQGVVEPLRAYLNGVFRPSSYHEALYLRGIYLVGDVPEDGAPVLEARPALGAPNAGAPNAGPQAAGRGDGGSRMPAMLANRSLVFVRDVFDRKVFGEGGLARPAQRTLVARNQRARVLQGVIAGFLVVMVTSMVLTLGRLNGEVRTMVPVLEQIHTDVTALRLKEQQAARGDVSGDNVSFFEEESARNLLDGITRLNTTTLSSAFLPTSWFSEMDRQVFGFLTLGFDTIVLRSMYNQLRVKAAALVDAPVQGGSALRTPSADEAVPLITEMAEFRSLQAFADELARLENSANLYNNIGVSTDLNGIGELARYLFGIELPEGFFTNAYFGRTALGNLERPRFDPSIYRGRAQSRVRQLGFQLFERLFYEAPLESAVRDLALRLRDFEESTGTRAEDAASFEQLLAAIQRAEGLLIRADAGGLSRDEFNPGEDFGRLLATVDRSVFLGRDSRITLEQSANQEFLRYKRKLAAYQSRLTGPVIDSVDGRIAMRLSAPVLQIKDALDGLVARRFMGRRAFAGLSDYNPMLQRMTWNSDLLHEAVDIFAEFDAFLARGLSRFPPELQRRVRLLALNRMNEQIMATVASAQELETMQRGRLRASAEADLARDIDNFRVAAPQLQQLLIVLRQLQLTDSYQRLFDVTSRQASYLLEEVDKLMADSQPYTVSEYGLMSWDGRTNPAAAALGLRDEIDARTYLDGQRGRIEIIARDYAYPMVDFLLNADLFRQGGNLALVSRWQRILDEIDRYNQRRPDSTILQLEQFIRSDLRNAGIGSCAEVLRPVLQAPVEGDFFLQRRTQLANQIIGQCAELSGGQAMSGYDRLAEAFEARLAGRYPFADMVDGERVPEVQPADLRAFFSVLDGFDAAQIAALRDMGDAQGRAAANFVETMRRVRSFMTPFLPREGAGTPQVELGVEFRVNREHEIGGNQIIEWRLRSGNATLSPFASESRVAWAPGDPLSITLRWAANAPMLPISDGRPGDPRVTDRAATFTYDNRWALVRFLERHLAPATDLPGGQDGTPHTLRFQVKTVPSGTPVQLAGGNPTDSAKVFVRVRVTPGAVDPDAPPAALVLPNFPRSAPRFGGSGTGPGGGL